MRTSVGRSARWLFALLAVLMIPCIAIACSEDVPQGITLADGSIRGGRDTVWVRDNKSGEWMLYWMMMNGPRPMYQPTTHIITYRTVTARTTALAAPRPASQLRPRYVPSTSLRPVTSAPKSWLAPGATRTFPRSSSSAMTYRPSTPYRSSTFSRSRY